jgi:predicted transcriptional regulator
MGDCVFPFMWEDLSATGRLVGRKQPVHERRDSVAEERNLNDAVDAADQHDAADDVEAHSVDAVDAVDAPDAVDARDEPDVEGHAMVDSVDAVD